MDWRNLRAYAFPPFNLIPAVLHKTRREMATLVLVAPLWSAQPWWCLSREQPKSPNGCVPSKGSSSFIPGSKTSRVNNIRKQFETAGLSATAIDLLTNSVKISTTKTYNCSWTQWSSYPRNNCHNNYVC